MDQALLSESRSIPAPRDRDRTQTENSVEERADLPAVHTPPERVSERHNERFPPILTRTETQVGSGNGVMSSETTAIVQLLTSRWHASVKKTGSDLQDEHIYITALLDGWDAVREHIGLDNGWRRLEDIDRNLVEYKDIFSRLCLVIILKIWMYHEHSDPTSQEAKSLLPPWGWKLPCQSLVPAKHIAHYFPWPGIREVICCNFSEYGSNEAFFEAYMKAWCVAWPYSLQDTIEKSPVTSMYQFTPEFRARVYDLRYWMFESDFIEAWPDFQGTANKLEPQLAVLRLHDRTREHERLIKRANIDPETRSLVQAYYDNVARLYVASTKVAREVRVTMAE